MSGAESPVVRERVAYTYTVGQVLSGGNCSTIWRRGEREHEDGTKTVEKWAQHEIGEERATDAEARALGEATSARLNASQA